MNITDIVQQFINYYTSSEPNNKYQLYATDCVSYEISNTKPVEVIHGLESIRHRSDLFYGQFSRVISKKVSQPLVGDSAFSLTISFEVEMKDGVKKQFEELCVFQVVEGKIARQEFFYE